MDADEIFFNDEKLFTCGGLLKGSTRNSRLWVEKGVAKKSIPPRDLAVEKKRWGEAVMVALAVSSKCVLEPKSVERGVEIDGATFADLLQNHYAPRYPAIPYDCVTIYTLIGLSYLAMGGDFHPLGLDTARKVGCVKAVFAVRSKIYGIIGLAVHR